MRASRKKGRLRAQLRSTLRLERQRASCNPTGGSPPEGYDATCTGFGGVLAAGSGAWVAGDVAAAAPALRSPRCSSSSCRPSPPTCSAQLPLTETASVPGCSAGACDGPPLPLELASVPTERSLAADDSLLTEAACCAAGVLLLLLLPCREGGWCCWWCWCWLCCCCGGAAGLCGAALAAAAAPPAAPAAKCCCLRFFSTCSAARAFLTSGFSTPVASAASMAACSLWRLSAVVGGVHRDECTGWPLWGRAGQGAAGRPGAGIRAAKTPPNAQTTPLKKARGAVLSGQRMAAQFGLSGQRRAPQRAAAHLPTAHPAVLLWPRCAAPLPTRRRRRQGRPPARVAARAPAQSVPCGCKGTGSRSSLQGRGKEGRQGRGRRREIVKRRRTRGQLRLPAAAGAA